MKFLAMGLLALTACNYTQPTTPPPCRVFHAQPGDQYEQGLWFHKGEWVASSIDGQEDGIAITCS